MKNLKSVNAENLWKLKVYKKLKVCEKLKFIKLKVLNLKELKF